jgi:competence protein ComGC
VKAAESQVQILQQQNALLKETQYDHALSLIEGQKKVFEIERETLQKQIADLRAAGNKQEEADVKARIIDTDSRIAGLEALQKCFQPGAPKDLSKCGEPR